MSSSNNGDINRSINLLRSIGTKISQFSVPSIMVGLSVITGLIILIVGMGVISTAAPVPVNSGGFSITAATPHQELGPAQIGEIENDNTTMSYLEEATLSRRVHYPGASYIKVHFAQLNLLPGDYLTVTDPAGTQVHTYPGSAFTLDEGEGFWALSILGDTAVIELHSAEHDDISIPPQHVDYYQLALSGAPLSELGVSIDRYARGYPVEQIQPIIDGTESTCGTNERTDVVCYDSSNPTEFQKSNAVARLLINSTSLCTAWRASDQNRVFTNEHCVTSQADVSGTEVRFNYQSLTCSVNDPAATTVVTGDTFLTDNYNYDFALFTVNNFETISSFGYLDLDPRTPVLNEQIYIPQHGAGDPKQFGIDSDMDSGNVCRIGDAIVGGRVANSDTGYFCDTTGGSSGSPVLARSNNQVIAIHHFGISGSTCSSSNMNQGVRMDLIWPLVEEYFSATPDVGPLVYDSHTIDDDNTGDSSGDGDGIAECGESIELFVDLLNQGADSASGVSASISTSDTYVTLTSNTTSSFPDIAGSGTSTNNDDYEFSLAANTPDNHVITFDLDITASNGGPWSDSFDVTAACDPPAAPTVLTATQVSSTQIDLVWQDNASDETAYYIERSPNGSTGWVEIDTTASDATTYSDSSLECDMTYYYRVRAYRSGDGQYSDYSNTADDTTYACATIEFIPGWNLISLPLSPITAYKAQSLLDDINSAGGACSEIDRWLNDTWDAHIDGLASNDFDVYLGDGYFIKCAQSNSWTMEGSSLGAGITLNLISGWNLVSIPYPVSGYLAQSLLDEINTQGGACSEADRWLNDTWDAHVDGLTFNNFSVANDTGYFIKCSSSSSFTP